MFNPDQIQYIKVEQLELPPRRTARACPPGSFSNGVPAILIVTLIFDGTENGENVAKTVNKLTSSPRSTSTSTTGGWPARAAPRTPSQSQQHRPPTVQFMWGTYLSFDAVIQKVITKFTLFLDDGTPVRASVEVTFMQIADEGVFPNQNPTSGGRTGSGSIASGRARRSTRSPTRTSARPACGAPWRRSTGSTIPSGSRPATRSSCRPSADDLKALA